MSMKKTVDPGKCEEEESVSLKITKCKCCNLSPSLTVKPSCYFRITVSFMMLFPFNI